MICAYIMEVLPDDKEVNVSYGKFTFEISVLAHWQFFLALISCLVSTYVSFLKQVSCRKCN